MILRCILDGLLVPAQMGPGEPRLLAYDGDEAFLMEALEAVYYELVAATRAELLGLQSARYRLLRFAADFEVAPAEPRLNPRSGEADIPW